MIAVVNYGNKFVHSVYKKMPYYDTIEQDLKRAKQILARGEPTTWERKNFPPEVIEALRKASGGTIYGADIYAAYMLLKSLVEEVERLRAEAKE